MTCCTIPRLQANLIDIQRSIHQKFSCKIHFIIQYKPIDRIAVYLLESFLQSIDRKLDFICQFLKSRGFGKTFDDDFFCELYFCHIFLVGEKWAFFQINPMGTVVIKTQKLQRLSMKIKIAND